MNRDHAKAILESVRDGLERGYDEDLMLLSVVAKLQVVESEAVARVCKAIQGAADSAVMSMFELQRAAYGSTDRLEP